MKELIPIRRAPIRISDIKTLSSVKRKTMIILAARSFLREIGYIKSNVMVLFLYSSITSLLSTTEANTTKVTLTITYKPSNISA
ncbi:hypothetical protein D3C79_997560 [compost metagenome]